MKFDLNNPETLFIDSRLESDVVNSMSEDTFKRVLFHGYSMKLSDISFQEGCPIMVKINNLVFPISKQALSAAVIQRVVSILHNAGVGDDSALQDIMHGKPSQVTYTFKFKRPGDDFGERASVRYRCNVIRDSGTSVCITMRLNNDEIKDLKDIGHSHDGIVYSNMFPMKGLNLITGAVDSGKTTLIYSCLGHFIRHSPRSAFIHTYENPIEGDLRGFARRHGVTNKVISQTPVPGGCANFMEGIENSLRRNTDIILIGEIRTRSEVEAVITGVNSTGKLLMGTLHTDSSAMTIDRLVHSLHSSNEGEMRAKIYDLLSALNIIVSQKLLSTVDKKRVAVYEVFQLDQSTRKELQRLEPEKLTQTIEGMMLDKKQTMVHMAKSHLDDGRISKETFLDFKNSFSYGSML